MRRGKASGVSEQDTMIFDGTDESLFALFEWAGQRFPAIERDGARIVSVAVSNPSTPVLSKAYPGDTIVRGEDGTLTVTRTYT